MTKVEDLMTTQVVAVAPDMPLVDAVAILTKRNFNGIPVVDEQNTFLGLLSERDMVSQKSLVHLATLIKLFNEIQFYKKDNSPIREDLKKILAMKVEDMMQRSCSTLKPADTIEQAAALFADPKVNPIPVVDEQKKLVGILALSDLAKLYGVATRSLVKGDVVEKNIDNFIRDFEKEFVVVTKFRVDTWFIVSILFAVIGFLIAMFFIMRVNL